MFIDLDLLTGKSNAHLIPFRGGPFLVHQKMHDALDKMFSKALTDGFDLTLMSSFRSFEMQQKIWNDKALGLRPLLDSNSCPIDISTKNKEEILFCILRWSAIPGGSRHHWGSDIDLFDQRSKPFDYNVQLIPSEYEAGGPFFESRLWLDEHMEEFGFFRPYFKDVGGIAPEPWHLSFREVSEELLEHFDLNAFHQHLSQSQFLLIDEARQHSEVIYNKFIQIPR